MARAPDPRIEQAEAMYRTGKKLVEIASQLNLPEGTVRRWKCTHKWNSERSEKKSERSHKIGPPIGNKNAVGHGAPAQNSNAEKHGLFRKYLPEETFSIISEMPKDSLDILWDQIQIAYAAIIRAQQIMYVQDRGDRTVSDDGIQQAWDKQGKFLQAQARAQSELRSLIKQYDEQLHRNWDLATEEQRTRIDAMRAKAQIDGGAGTEAVRIVDDI